MSASKNNAAWLRECPSCETSTDGPRFKSFTCKGCGAKAIAFETVEPEGFDWKAAKETPRKTSGAIQGDLFAAHDPVQALKTDLPVQDAPIVELPVTPKPNRWEFSAGGYSAGHPCYYKEGGHVIGVKYIKGLALINPIDEQWKELFISECLVKDIEKRRAKLNALRAETLNNLWKRDIPKYRAMAVRLRRWRRDKSLVEPEFPHDSVTDIYLKFNHIYGNFKSLRIIEIELDAIKPKQQALFAA